MEIVMFLVAVVLICVLLTAFQYREDKKARANGCICDQRGLFVRWIDSDCPYHNPKEED